jgi:hypothetical protein
MLPGRLRLRTIAAAALVAVALAGCATPGRQPDDDAYVGVFTGEYVDGVPLYRLPPIEVVGFRGRGFRSNDGGM